VCLGKKGWKKKKVERERVEKYAGNKMILIRINYCRETEARQAVI
jgi:hypothetical protein